MGPLNTARQRDYVAGLLEQAKAAGAEVQTYGEYTGDWASGNYMLPSLVLDPAPDLGIVTEEQFGLTVPVLPYDDEEQVIRLANARDGRPVRAARALNQNP
jgi:acyl-CoA reductase-like NAD-dependent aldehyde dehydrogenase